MHTVALDFVRLVFLVVGGFFVWFGICGLLGNGERTATVGSYRKLGSYVTETTKVLRYSDGGIRVNGLAQLMVGVGAIGIAWKATSAGTLLYVSLALLACGILIQFIANQRMSTVVSGSESTEHYRAATSVSIPTSLEGLQEVVVDRIGEGVGDKIAERRQPPK